MDRARWEELKALFDQALEMSRLEREAYLGDACAGDDALYREVTSLLAAHSQTFLETAPLLSDAEGGIGPRPDALIGSSIDAYRIVELIGSGGMGDVYRAEHAATGERVAIKRLGGAALADPKSRLRFEQEARVAMSLRHPNVVGVRQVVERRGELFLVMDYVEGRTLRHVLEEQDLGLEEALDYALQIMTALSKAHELGIVHRDVKPDNIMITERGKAKVLDFGLVKLVEPENVHDAPTRDKRSISREGIVLGSASYMSPEQINGETVDGRSDVFSMGAILYEMLAGRRAFTGSTALEIVSSVLWDEPESLRSVVPELDAVVRRALEKRPENRFPSMVAFRETLAALKERGRLAVLEEPLERVSEPKSPRRWLGSLFSPRPRKG